MFKKTDIETGEQQAREPALASAPARIPDHQAQATTGDKAMIGTTIVIKGDVSGEEDLLVQGRVEGSIQLKQNNLTIGKEGSIKANVHAKAIFIEGEVEGDLQGDERIVIQKTGTVRGNLVAPRVSLEDGAKFKGSIDMEPATAQSSAPVRAISGGNPGNNAAKPEEKPRAAGQNPGAA